MRALRNALDRAVRASGSPGAVALVGDISNTYFFEAAGSRQIVPRRKPATKDTLYDVASLTKVVATTPAVMLLRDQGIWSLDDDVTDHVPIDAYKGITLRHLLTHTAGLIPYITFYDDVGSVDEALRRYAEDGIIAKPGEERAYSDAGYMLLARAVEHASGASFDEFCRKRIFDPLKMKRTGFNPANAWRDNCAATEHSEWRSGMIVGEVHDENAYAVGGVAGHAGLFTTAEDLAIFCRAVLSGGLFDPAVLEEMTRIGQVAVYPWQGLGWELDPWDTEKKGSLPARTVFGHSGWTGVSMWLDRETQFFVVLLGNTCHPTRKTRDNHTLRGIFHAAVAQRWYPNQANTHSGLDRLVNEQFKRLEDRNVAVLTNSAAKDQLGRPILDLLRQARGVALRYIYSPEHGFARTAEAGEAVQSRNEEIPVISLYGDRAAPSPEELRDVDLLVVDLQDVGARYYTYMATMKAALAACAANGVEVLVLDRPNPLGGKVLEGPIARNTDSLVSSAPIPVRHGMTMGELAIFYRRWALKESELQLSVSGLDNWSPARFHWECALPWVPPSPNMPSAKTALLYVGTCLFEGTNLNEGRGTDEPFHVFGAPWFDAAGVITRVPARETIGCELEPATYTPRAIPGKATSPKFLNEPCGGIRIHIRDPRTVRPFRLVLGLLSAIHDRHAGDFAFKPYFDTLAGSDVLRRQVQAGKTVDAIVGEYADELETFDRIRPKLYHAPPWKREEIRHLIT